MHHLIQHNQLHPDVAAALQRTDNSTDKLYVITPLQQWTPVDNQLLKRHARGGPAYKNVRPDMA